MCRVRLLGFVMLGLVVTALGLCLQACNGDLPKATLIVHMRVLGARTEVKGDVTRTTPKPGETAHMTFSMAYPSIEEDDSELSSLFVSCTAPTMFTGIPTCQELIDAAKNPTSSPGKVLMGFKGGSCKGFEGKSIKVGSIGNTCVTNTPQLDIAIEATTKIRSKLVLGVICRNGTPFISTTGKELFGCDPKKGVKTADVETIAVYGTVPIQYKSADTNQNPDITLATLKLAVTSQGLDGAKSWTETKAADLPAMDDDCADAAKAKLLPQVDGAEEVIRIAYPAKPRETHSGEAETLEISNYATAGELKRRFTLFPPDHVVVKGLMQDEVTWKLTKNELPNVGPNGLLVRFFFTVLDRHGGFDITTRAVCVIR